MGLFNSSNKQQSTTGIPPQVFARIQVMNDYVSSPNVTEEKLRETVNVPKGAAEIPHGPFVTDASGGGIARVEEQVVSKASAESSPFLQNLSSQELLVSKNKKPNVEAPLFLSAQNQSMPFNFGQTNNVPQPPIPSGGSEQLVVSDVVEPPLLVVPHKRSYWVFVIWLFVFASALVGAYYYLYVYSVMPLTIPIVIPPIQTDPNDLVPQESQTGFSLTSPNYFPLNIETVLEADVRTQIQTTGERIQLAQISQPVEFLVTDQTNTPIAFSRFVILSGLQLPEDIVSLTEERFSLFIFSDQGQQHVGLRVQLKQAGDTTVAAFRKLEGDFPALFQRFLLGAQASPLKRIPFKQSIHNGTTIRYVNIPGVKAMSVDYAFVGNEWYVGTSKNTLRAVLDARKK